MYHRLNEPTNLPSSLSISLIANTTSWHSGLSVLTTTGRPLRIAVWIQLVPPSVRYSTFCRSFHCKSAGREFPTVVDEVTVAGLGADPVGTGLLEFLLAALRTLLRLFCCVDVCDWSCSEDCRRGWGSDKAFTDATAAARDMCTRNSIACGLTMILIGRGSVSVEEQSLSIHKFFER